MGLIQFLQTGLRNLAVFIVRNTLFRLSVTRRYIQRNLSHPGNGIYGYLVKVFMDKVNRGTSEKAVEMMQLKPGETFLEVGYGAGWGLRKALTYDPKKIIGYDMSERMYNECRQAKDLQDSRIELHHGSCLKMSAVQDSTVDKLFHLNVTYFLDPLSDYAEEFYRVLSRGGVMYCGVKMDKIKNLDEDIFVNRDAEAAAQILRQVGFDVEIKDIQETNDYDGFSVIVCTKNT